MTESRPEAVPKTAGATLPSVSCEETMPKTPLAMKAKTITNPAVRIAFAPEGRTANPAKSTATSNEAAAITREGEPTFSATHPKKGAETREIP